MYMYITRPPGDALDYSLLAFACEGTRRVTVVPRSRCALFNVTDGGHSDGALLLTLPLHSTARRSAVPNSI